MQWLLILLQSTLVLQLFCLLGQSQSADGCCVFGFHAIGSRRHSIFQHTRSPILVTFSRDIDGLSKALHGSISEKWFVYNLGIGSLRKRIGKSHRTSFPKRRKLWKKRKPITLGPNWSWTINFRCYFYSSFWAHELPIKPYLEKWSTSGQRLMVFEWSINNLSLYSIKQSKCEWKTCK